MHPEVRREIFLVIPHNTVTQMTQTSFQHPDYTVHVIGPDALEPILLSLQRIEAYEFAEQLSPEDRESICRIIGKFAHTAKRKIQIDTYLNEQFLNLLEESSYSLPEEILAAAVKFERSEKLNPPTERRAKEISMTKIRQDIHKQKSKAQLNEIDTDAELTVIDQLPLALPGKRLNH